GASLLAYDTDMASLGYIIDKPLGLVRQIIVERSDTVYDANDPRYTSNINFDNTVSIDVTGHSLGGHLSAAFTRLFGHEALTINGAGYPTGVLPGLGLEATSNIANVFKALGGESQFNSNSIHNLYGDRMPEFVTMDSVLGLVQQGSSDAVYIEQPTAFSHIMGHGADQMTDSLAVYDLFIHLDKSLQTLAPQQALEKLMPLFKAASADATTSLETLVNALADLFHTGIRIDETETDNREALYKAINAIKNSDLYKSAENVSTILLTDQIEKSDYVDVAINDNSKGEAYCYALKHLNPFVVLSDSDIYAQHTTDHELDIYNPATGKGLTEQWITDRAAMLYGLVEFNSKELDISLPSGADIPPFSPSKAPDDWNFTDLSSNKPLTLLVKGNGGGFHHIKFGGFGENTLTGSGDSDHLYGMEGSDVLTGNSGNDYLEGGSGLDTLNGGKGNDTLMGGQGTDTYEFTGDFGNDIILDSDGKGSIQIDGQTLSSATKLAE
ncbi:hypothetical protein DOJK_00738, partial [Patescibacteria group bacterium]